MVAYKIAARLKNIILKEPIVRRLTSPEEIGRKSYIPGRKTMFRLPGEET